MPASCWQIVLHLLFHERLVEPQLWIYNYVYTIETYTDAELCEDADEADFVVICLYQVA